MPITIANPSELISIFGCTIEEPISFQCGFPIRAETTYINNDALKSKNIRSAIIYIRSQKLPDTRVAPNVGSFFKNPIVPGKVADQILKKFPKAKFFKVDNNLTKVPAGWLIENAGLKGKSFGNVSVYDKNAIVLVNNGNATKEDFMNAKNEITKIVEEKFGIKLEQEPEIV